LFARHVLMSSLKNEGPFILEWVAHHRVVGFDAIYVASNDCSDGSDALLAALDRAGIIGHVPNEVAPGVIPQHAGYDRIRASHPIDRAEWLMMLDTDEFLNIHIGQNRVQDLTMRAGAADIIAVSARSFSDLPQTHWEPGPVTRAFPMALRLHHRANQSVKTLTRAPARFRGIHRDFGFLCLYLCNIFHTGLFRLAAVHKALQVCAAAAPHCSPRGQSASVIRC
jgi:hypothetical protein